MLGLAEAVEDAKSSDKKLKRRVVSIIPVKEYGAEQVKQIRKSTGMSQKVFASYMGVSAKTVEAWEAGINRPSGAASRLLSMLEMNEHLVEEFPFVKMGD
jgi:putative transcriptional regulator